MGLMQSFCCGCTLQQGALVSGIITSIGGILSIVGGWFVIVYIMPNSRDPRLPFAMAGLAIMFGLFKVISSGLLFTALTNRKPNYLLPWIVWQSTELFFAFCIVLFGFVIELGMLFVLIVLYTFFLVYLYIVVVSYYKSLQQPQLFHIPVQMISVAPGGYNQTMYAVSIDPNYPVPPMTAYNAGMVPLPGYDPRAAGVAAMTGDDPRGQPLPPIPTNERTASGMTNDSSSVPLDTKLMPQDPTNSEYTTNPPPYRPTPPPAYS